MDWNNPSAPSPWNDKEKVRFNKAMKEILVKSSKELGEDFQIIDESNESN